jgi:hypothetical protein
VGVRNALLLRQVGDRLSLPASPLRRQHGAHEHLDQCVVAARLPCGAGTPSGGMISFRPPRCCSRIGTHAIHEAFGAERHNDRRSSSWLRREA